MSQGIMERNLPVAESLGSGDKVRIVTSAGNSKQIDASQIGGGGVLVVNIVDHDPASKASLLKASSATPVDPSTQKVWLDKTYNEIYSAIQNNVFVPVFCYAEVNGNVGYETYYVSDIGEMTEGCFVGLPSPLFASGFFTSDPNSYPYFDPNQ